MRPLVRSLACALAAALAAACGSSPSSTDDEQPGATGGAASRGGSAASAGGRAPAGDNGGGTATGGKGGATGPGGKGGASGGKATGGTAGSAGSAGSKTGSAGSKTGSAGSKAGSAGEGAASGMAGGPSSGGGSGETGTAGTGSGGTGGADPAGGAGSSGADPGAPHLAFVAIGDSGKGNSEAKKVGEAVAAKCLASGCDFVQLLGDNIYDDGAESVSDEQWKTKFVEPYASVSQPFWVVLGNHDYGGNGAGYEDNKADVQVAYSKTNPKWKLPARYYHHVEGPAELFALDTNAVMFGNDDQQRKDLVTWIGASKAPWKIALGHHPYRSNGKHGNAGGYDGLPSFIPVASGANVKELTEEILCGKVDLYLAGHDHSRQWLKTTCQGTELVVSGAGSGVTTLPGDNPAYFQAKTVGFVYVEVYVDKLTITMIDADGKEEYARTIVKLAVDLTSSRSRRAPSRRKVDHALQR